MTVVWYFVKPQIVTPPTSKRLHFLKNLYVPSRIQKNFLYQSGALWKDLWKKSMLAGATPLIESWYIFYKLSKSYDFLAFAGVVGLLLESCRHISLQKVPEFWGQIHKATPQKWTQKQLEKNWKNCYTQWWPNFASWESWWPLLFQIPFLTSLGSHAAILAFLFGRFLAQRWLGKPLLKCTSRCFLS